MAKKKKILWETCTCKTFRKGKIWAEGVDCECTSLDVNKKQKDYHIQSVRLLGKIKKII